MTFEKNATIDSAVSQSEFCSQLAKTSLRVTCYGSSSAKTPERYLKEARSLGYILARRGHVCVNGAGSFGCMAAMNDGAVAGNGHIVGVIHEMFLVDGSYDTWESGKKVDRDGNAHTAFASALSKNSTKREGPLREIVVAGGDDLQQRKKLLVNKADALVVLPGGPGTWDELWEMACARQLGLVQLPIVCVNVDGFYEPFREMLDKAYEDKLIKLEPQQIVHFSPTAEEAVRWVEASKEFNTEQIPKVGQRSAVAKPFSLYSSRSFEYFKLTDFPPSAWPLLGLTFSAGLASGFAIMYARR